MKGAALSRTEVIKAIEMKGPRRVPCWYTWIADETWDKYGGELETTLEPYFDDVVLVDYDMPRGFTEPAPGRDEWGIYYVSEPGVFSGMRSSDLKDVPWELLEEKVVRNPPDPHAPGRFDGARKLRTERPDVYLAGHWWALYFERMIALRREEDLLADCLVDRGRVDRLGWTICDFFCGIVDEFAEAGMDGIFFSDDLGFSNQLIFPPGVFRDLFKPWYRTLFARIRRHGMHVIMHSCGFLWEIIPDLIECGLQVFHFQPSVLDMKRLVREYGKDLSFFGGIDIQRFLTASTADQVRRGIRQIFRALDREPGGYLAGPSNTIMPDTPFENIRAMLEAMEEHGDRGTLH